MVEKEITTSSYGLTIKIFCIKKQNFILLLERTERENSWANKL